MIKYLGSKRALVPVLADMAVATGAATAVDLFTGTTRVARELKRRGLQVTAADIATYSEVLAACYIGTDRDAVDPDELRETLAELEALPGRAGYFTATFCERARFFQPKNGARVDAIRDAIETRHRDSPLYPLLLTSLLLAADRVDSTTGLQMAYLKEWAPRAHRDLELQPPDLLPGVGTTIRGDALATVEELPPTDLMYLDPPYNQHRYFTNYHIWETLVRWDAPEHYGVACKRVDSRDVATKSPFNSRRTMPQALSALIARARAEVLMVSYNDESWVSVEEMVAALRAAGHEEVRVLGYDSQRYVGARIGIYSPAGAKVGRPARLRNTEYVFVAGPREKVEAAVAAGGRGVA
ncbi:DNA adenine methylase [Nocardioides sambongensis]|uniref:DNA adenine methylase n=1 Tax=Nocardioides sambongensis TaxID=2589074 RepID=UPI001126FEF1|nr:DNA adenine methylase [Nocardioides sambongensis]